MSEMAIEVKDLTVRYGRKVAAEQVRLNVPRTAHALLGRNGAGKSSGLLSPRAAARNVRPGCDVRRRH